MRLSKKRCESCMNRVYKSGKLYCDITKIFEPFPPSVINYDQSVTFYSFHYSGTSITSAIYFMRASLNNTSVTLAPYQDIFIMTCFRATLCWRSQSANTVNPNFIAIHQELKCQCGLSFLLMFQGNERLGFFLFESVYTEMPVSCTAMAFLHRPAN